LKDKNPKHKEPLSEELNEELNEELREESICFQSKRVMRPANNFKLK